MITNYAGIEQAEKDAKELEEKYKTMLEYGKDELPVRAPSLQWLAFALIGVFVCGLAVFLAIILF